MELMRVAHFSVVASLHPVLQALHFVHGARLTMVASDDAAIQQQLNKLQLPQLQLLPFLRRVRMSAQEVRCLRVD